MTSTIQDERAALKRVLRGQFFRRAPRCSELLQILCEHRWGEDHGPLSQYILAESLYQSLEETALTKVRRAVGEVRRRLDQYYLHEGADDLLRIEVPKGTYEARFHLGVGQEGEAGRTSNADDEPSDPDRTAPRDNKRLTRFILTLFLVSSLVAMLLIALPDVSSIFMNPGSGSIKINGNRLVILDDWGRSIATRTLGYELQPIVSDMQWKHVDRGDLNGDGNLDLVIATSEKGGANGLVHILLGNDHEWLAPVPLARRLAGSAIRHTPRFLPHRVKIIADPQGNASFIYVAAASIDGSLGYLLHLSPDGDERALLWTWGHPTYAVAQADLDADGSIEVLAGVRHDEPSRPGTAVIVLSPAHASGFVPHPRTNRYFPPSAEIKGFDAYVHFPPSDLTVPGHKNYVHSIDILQETGQIKVIVTEGVGGDLEAEIWYWLTPSLEVERVQLHDNYIRACRITGCSVGTQVELQLASQVSLTIADSPEVANSAHSSSKPSIGR